MARRRGLLWLLGGSCWVSSATGAPRLIYDVQTGCPDQAWFERELLAQELPADVRGQLSVEVTTVPKPPPGDASPKAAPQSASDEVQLEPELLSAELRYAKDSASKPRAAGRHAPALETEHTEPEWQRALSGPDCEELLSVLAVSFAVYIESRDESELPPALHDEPLPPVVEPNWFDPPKLDYVASATWRLGLIAGLGIRTGLAPSATGSWHAAIHLRGVRAGWGAGPIQLGIGSQLGPNRNEVTSATDVNTTWAEEYWTVHLLAAPWMDSPAEGVRFGPALGLHGGRFGARLPRVRIATDDDDVWFAFCEMLMLGEVQRGPLLARIQLGFQFPVSPYRVHLEERELYHQQAGLVLGFGLGWAGVLL
jgi:hypothetical protein